MTNPVLVIFFGMSLWSLKCYTHGMNSLFAGAVFTREDIPSMLLFLVAGILLTLVPVALIIWGLLGLKKKDKQTHRKRIALIIIGLLILFIVQAQFNLFGWLLF
jgi:hypothetical protein